MLLRTAGTATSCEDVRYADFRRCPVFIMGFPCECDDLRCFEILRWLIAYCPPKAVSRGARWITSSQKN